MACSAGKSTPDYLAYNSYQCQGKGLRTRPLFSLRLRPLQTLEAGRGTTYYHHRAFGALPHHWKGLKTMWQVTQHTCIYTPSCRSTCLCSNTLHITSNRSDLTMAGSITLHECNHLHHFFERLFLIAHQEEWTMRFSACSSHLCSANHVQTQMECN